ncbi:MAG TPA: hypothetical protein ENK14_03985, partial [Caldithrix sp.]|nr:hypothetical protein [Caldithrix sp.]
QVALSWHRGGKGVQMLDVPSDPVNSTWPWQQISTASQDECLSAGDIDSDGDLDLLLGTKWLENDNSSWNLHTLSNYNADPDRNRLFDMNGDGRLDAVVGFEAISSPGKLAWYEQGSSATGIWTEHLIATVVGPMSLDVADMDNDGDLDVIVGEHNLANPSQANLFIFENSDGQAGSWIQHLVYQGDEHHDGARVVDIDGDGDLDIISIGWGHSRVLLYENKAVGGTGQMAPVIITHPYSVTVVQGQTATFTVVASGSAPLQYQWQKNGVDIAGATSSAYVTPPTTIADNGSKYRCLVSNAFGSAQSNEATLTIIQQGTGHVSLTLVALYTFAEGTGNIIHDVSGVAPSVDLEIDNLSSVSWDSVGLNVVSPCQISSNIAASKIIDSCMATNEITIEAWLQTGNLNQTGPARIVTLSADYYNRNFTMGQNYTDHDIRLRTTNTGNNGDSPSLPVQNTASTDLSHLVYVRSASGEAKIYVDGTEKASAVISGDFSNWSSSFHFGLANEISGGRPWLGKFYLVSIYNRALSSTEISQNFFSGPYIFDSALPVTLSRFVAIGGNSQVRLEWVTESEVQNVGFDILRSTEKNGDYSKIAFVEGQFSNNTRTEYEYIDQEVVNGTTYWYKLVDVNINGVRTEHSIVNATPLGKLVPSNIVLFSNYPNPFNPSTKLRYRIPQSSQKLVPVDVSVYNVLGQRIKTLFKGNVEAGNHELVWNGTSDNGITVPGGIYYAVLRSEGVNRVVRMVLLK